MAVFLGRFCGAIKPAAYPHVILFVERRCAAYCFFS